MASQPGEMSFLCDYRPCSRQCDTEVETPEKRKLPTLFASVGPVAAVFILFGVILGRNCRTDTFIAFVVFYLVKGAVLDKIMAYMDEFWTLKFRLELVANRKQTQPHPSSI